MSNFLFLFTMFSKVIMAKVDIPQIDNSAISSFDTMFSKAVCCGGWFKLHLAMGKGGLF